MITVDKSSVTQPGTASTQTASAPAQPGSRFADKLSSVQHRGRDLDPIFAKAAEKYGVPQELLRAIAFHESGFQTDAVSHAGAMGLMQLMPVTVQAMGVSNPFDPEQNVMGGAKLLGQYLEKYDGNLKLTLAAYGAGCGAVAKYNGIPPYKETQNFVADIMSVVHSGGLPAWDHTGAPTSALAAVSAASAKTMLTPAAAPAVTVAAATTSKPFAAKTMVTPVSVSTAADAAPAVRTAVTPASVSVVADAAPSADQAAVNAILTAVPIDQSDVDDETGRKVITPPLAMSGGGSPAAASSSAAANAAMKVITPPLAMSAAATAVPVFSRAAPAAVVSAAQIAAQNLAELMAANDSKRGTSAAAAVAPPTADAEAFRAALSRGLSSIGTGNLAALQAALQSRSPSAAAITDLFRQIDEFDGFSEEDYQLLVSSLLAEQTGII